MTLITRIALRALPMFVVVACAGYSSAQQLRSNNTQQPVTTEAKTTVDYSVSRIVRPEETAAARETTKTEAVNTSTAEVVSPKPATTSSPKPAPSSSDEWHLQFSPYIWIAGVTGQAGVGSLVVNVDSGLGDSNVHLNFGFMGTMEARKNKFILLTDLQYSNIGTERPNPGVLFSSATADFKTFILDPEVGYRLGENKEKGSSVDLLGGVRYWHLRTDLNFAAGVLSARSATATRGWVDGVVGVRGKMFISPKVFMVGKGDIGGGGSSFTYQLFGGFGYQISKSIGVVGGYRGLHVNYNRDNFLFNNTLHGPLVGLTFKIK